MGSMLIRHGLPESLMTGSQLIQNKVLTKNGLSMRNSEVKRKIFLKTRSHSRNCYDFRYC